MTDLPDLEGLRIRPGVRAALIDPDDRVLLVRFEFPRATVWATPGGGQEPGEDDETTLRRELHEELGLVGIDIGPHLWTRTHVIPFLDGRWDGQRENIYLVRTPAFEPPPALELGAAAGRAGLWDAMVDARRVGGGPSGQGLVRPACAADAARRPRRQRATRGAVGRRRLIRARAPLRRASARSSSTPACHQRRIGTATHASRRSATIPGGADDWRDVRDVSSGPQPLEAVYRADLARTDATPPTRSSVTARSRGHRPNGLHHRRRPLGDDR